MILQEFINKYFGKSLVVLPASRPVKDGGNGPQCYDVAVAWTDNLGIPHYPGNPSPFPYDSAYKIFTEFSSWQAQYFNKIINTAVNFPSPGAVIVFKTSVGPDGHVAVVEKADTNSVTVIEQNWNGVQRVTRRTITNWDDIHGWLQPKDLPVSTNPTPPSNSTSTSPLEAKWTTYTSALNAHKDDVDVNYYTDDPKRIVDDVIKYKNSNEVLTGNNEQLAKNIDALVKAHQKELTDKETEFERNLSNLDKELLKETQRADEAEKALKEHVCPTWYSGLLQAIQDVKEYLKKHGNK